MDYIEFVIGLLGGATGCGAIMIYISKRWFDHRIDKRFEEYKFLLDRRTEAFEGILLWIGRIINEARQISETSQITATGRENLLNAINKLEDYLRPARIYFDLSTYNRIHEYKTCAQNFHKDTTLSTSTTKAAQDSVNIQGIVAQLEEQRNRIEADLSAQMPRV